MNEDKRRDLSRLTHDMRSPLNVIIGFAEFMRDGCVGPVTKAQHDYLEEILKSSRQLLGIIDEISSQRSVEKATGSKGA